MYKRNFPSFVASALFATVVVMGSGCGGGETENITDKIVEELEEESSSSSSESPVEITVSDGYVLNATVICGEQMAVETGNGKYKFTKKPTDCVILVTNGINDVNANGVVDVDEPKLPILKAAAGYLNVNPFTTMMVETGLSSAGLRKVMTNSGIDFGTLPANFDFDIANTVTRTANFEVAKEATKFMVAIADFTHPYSSISVDTVTSELIKGISLAQIFPNLKETFDKIDDVPFGGNLEESSRDMLNEIASSSSSSLSSSSSSSDSSSSSNSSSDSSDSSSSSSNSSSDSSDSSSSSSSSSSDSSDSSSSSSSSSSDSSDSSSSDSSSSSSSSTGSSSSYSAFFDTLDSLDSNLWEKSNGWCNEGIFANCWSSDQVNFEEGSMIFTLSDVNEEPYEDEDNKNIDLQSGEYRSKNKYGYGYYEVSLKASDFYGTVAGFFTYTAEAEGGDPHDEIDIEIRGDDPYKIQINYWTNGIEHPTVIDLDFNAAENFHTYGFDWSEDKIDWYVDGNLVHTEDGTNGALPTHPGKIMTNFWGTIGAGDWSSDFDVESYGPATMEVSRILYIPNK